MTAKTAFGVWIEERLGAKRPPWTQAELARQSHVHQSTISRWVSGETAPNAGKLEQVADALGEPINVALEKAGLLGDSGVRNEARETILRLVNRIEWAEGSDRFTMIRSQLEYLVRADETRRQGATEST